MQVLALALDEAELSKGAVGSPALAKFMGDHGLVNGWLVVDFMVCSWLVSG